MMEHWLQQTIELLPNGSTYLFALFVVAFAESIPIIGLLVPGSSAIIFAGFLVLHGKCTLPLLITITATGALIGDLVSFYLGFYYGSNLLKLKSFQKRRILVTRSERFFVEHGGKSIFFARFLGPIRGTTPFIAGLSGMPKRSFVLYALISAILWGIFYPGLGYLGGSSWQNVQSLSTRFSMILVVILLATILHYWIRKNFKKK